MFSNLDPQNAPEAFLSYKAPEVKLSDLYGAKVPSYHYVSYKDVATEAEREHYLEFEIILNRLQQWAEKQFSEAEASKFFSILAKFHELYKKAEIGDLKPQEYNKMKERLEAICLLFWTSSKPANEKQALFRNFIQELTVCPDGVYTSMPHLKAMLEEGACFEAWLARLRYDLVEKAKNNFLQEVYDPDGLMGGMDIHVLNAFIKRATELGYAPSVDLKDVERDRYVPQIIREYSSFIVYPKF